MDNVSQFINDTNDNIYEMLNFISENYMTNHINKRYLGKWKKAQIDLDSLKYITDPIKQEKIIVKACKALESIKKYLKKLVQELVYEGESDEEGDEIEMLPDVEEEIEGEVLDDEVEGEVIDEPEEEGEVIDEPEEEGEVIDEPEEEGEKKE